jgi:hypothetical protein
MTTVTFCCNDLSVTTMDSILLPLSPFLYEKTWKREKEIFYVHYRYEGLMLTKKLRNKIEQSNGIIKQLNKY